MKNRVLLVCIVLFSVVSIESFAGTLLHSTRKLGLVAVNTTSLDSQTRLQSYQSALAPVFQDINVQSLQIYDEFTDPDFDTKTIRLLQYHNGLPVRDAYTIISVSKMGTADFATAHYYQGLTLPNYAFLADKNDSTVLDSAARSVWPEIASDAEVHVSAQVLPVEVDTSGAFNYFYALNIGTPEHGPERFYDWQTGTLLKEGGRIANVQMNVDIVHQVFDPSLGAYGEYRLVSENSPGIGYFYNPVPHECYDPVDGDCFFPDDGNLRFEEHAMTPHIDIYRVGHDNENGTWWYNHNSRWWGYEDFFCDNGADCDLPVTFESGWAFGDEEDAAALYNLNSISRLFAHHFGDPRFTRAVTSQDDLDDDAIAFATREDDHNVMFFGLNPGTNIPGATPAKSADVAMHEYGHCYQFTCGYPSDAVFMARKALMEGTADFFVASLANDHIIERDQYSDGRKIFWDPEAYNYPRRYDLEFEEHVWGRIYSSALWQMRLNIGSYGELPQGYDLGTYCFVLLGKALQHLPEDFRDLSEQLILNDDELLGDNDIMNGSPNGQALFDAMTAYMFPVGNYGPFIYYTNSICNFENGDLESTCFPRVDSWDAISPSNSSNNGAFGFNSAFVVNNTANFIFGQPDAENWLSPTAKLSIQYDDGFDVHEARNVSISRNGMYIVWDEYFFDHAGAQKTRSHPRGRAIVTDGFTLESITPFESFGQLLPGFVWFNSDPIVGPVVLSELSDPYVFVGISGSEQPAFENGIWYQRYDDIHVSTVGNPVRIPETESANVTSLSVYAAPIAEPDIWVAWVSDGRVRCTFGRTSASSITSWHTPYWTLGEVNRNPTNATIGYAPGIDGVFVAWEETNPATGKKQIAVVNGYSTGGNPSAHLGQLVQ